LSIDDLADLFQPDNIREGVSVTRLKEWGGLEGLEKLLNTNYQRGIFSDPKDHQKRADEYGDNQPIVKPPKTIM